jgi:cytoskeletal protein CcmA (bactofilin family)
MFARNPIRESRQPESLRAAVAAAEPAHAALPPAPVTPAAQQMSPQTLSAYAALVGPPAQSAQPPAPVLSVVPTAGSGPLEGSRISIIGRDLTIIGNGLKIISKGILQVDGEVQGDLYGAEIVIGEEGRVAGLINGERVIVRGQVAGTIRGVQVTLAPRANVEAEIQHQTLTIEQGAMFEGKARRHTDASQLLPDLDGSEALDGSPAEASVTPLRR